MRTDVLHSRVQAGQRTSSRWYAASSRLALYLELTKPGISVFVALSAAAGYVVAASAGTTWLGAALVMMCTALMSGGAAALNQVVEADRDRAMLRTRERPVASGLIEVERATAFAWSLALTGLIVALITLPPLTALFLALCHVSYVNIYTPLKLRTPLCTLVGALPGSLPVLAGAAASGTGIEMPALLLTGVLFTWQLPHFMAIGWLAREDYARGNYSMLFLTDGSGRESAQVAVLYAVVMMGCALLLAYALSTSALFYGVVIVSGSVFTGLAGQFLRARGRTEARKLFFSSLLVLPVMLVTLVIELLALR